MTQIQTVANIAEIVGGVAILVSLIYVGFQIRQSNQFARAENTRFVLDANLFDGYNYAVLARGMNDFDSLELSEKEEFHRYMFRMLQHYRMVLDTGKMGLLDASAVDEWTVGLAQVVITKGGEQWWQGGGKDSGGGQSRQTLEKYITENKQAIVPYNKAIRWMDLEAT
jgi:hypothetical protein